MYGTDDAITRDGSIPYTFISSVASSIQDSQSLLATISTFDSNEAEESLEISQVKALT
jgi:hypothetical protein